MHVWLIIGSEHSSESESKTFVTHTHNNQMSPPYLALYIVALRPGLRRADLIIIHYTMLTPHHAMLTPPSHGAPG